MSRETDLLTCQAPEVLPASDIAALANALQLAPSELGVWLDVDVSAVSICHECRQCFVGNGDHCGRDCSWLDRQERARQYAAAWQESKQKPQVAPEPVAAVVEVVAPIAPAVVHSVKAPQSPKKLTAYQRRLAGNLLEAAYLRREAA